MEKIIEIKFLKRFQFNEIFREIAIKCLECLTSPSNINLRNLYYSEMFRKSKPKVKTKTLRRNIAWRKVCFTSASW